MSNQQADPINNVLNTAAAAANQSGRGDSLSTTQQALHTLVSPLDYALIHVLGLHQPWQRFAFGYIGTSALVYMLQPSFMFDQNGEARPWSLLEGYLGDEDSEAPPTLVPWWMPGFFVGGFFSIFV